MLENYNLNRFSKSPSGDDFSDWLYQNTEAEAPDSDTSMAWNKLKNSIEEKPVKKTDWSYLKVAAVVALLAVSGYFILDNSSEPEIVEFSATDSKRAVKLPDGSKVVMNIGSMISFPEKFEGERNITLQGEAYFDVKKSESPFVVSLMDIKVEVLGTAFNIDENTDNVQVYVDHGLVRVTDSDEQVKLSKGEMAEYNRADGSLDMLPEISQNVMSWRNGKFEFVDVPLTFAAMELSEYYQIDIVADQRIKECRITASFDNEPLSKVVEVLETILDIKIVEKDSALYLKGKGC